MKAIFAVCLLCLCAMSVPAHADIDDSDAASGLSLLNRIDYSPLLTTSGQPTEAELGQVASAGYDRVIFLAFTNHPKALNHVDDIVRGLGLHFVHVPVLWQAPSLADFEAFAAVMSARSSDRTLVHCEVNFRASVFGFLYQVIYEGVDVDAAMSLMHAIWIPNDTWERFIARVLDQHGIRYEPL